MAIGATWDANLAERDGEIVGRELEAVGVNLLLGPDLDVVAVPQAGGSGDLGVRSFGGSPHWVGRMGQRFIEGVHIGGQGRVATAAGHFPGIGGADRSAEDDVAVVEQTYQQLSAVDLVPFGSVMAASRAPGVTDALVTSHVRYRGVQQQIERPLALDSGGLRYLLGQAPASSAWRNGLSGVLVTPGLGLPAVRRYDDPELRTFNERRVIREALAAGHDLLVVTGFGDDTASEATAIRDGIAWLAGVYEEDEAVRDAVDRAAERVLTLKRRLYPDFTPASARVDAGTAAAVTGLGTEDVQAVARDAVTRIAPFGVPVAAPSSVEAGEQVLFVVDARPTRLCRECPELQSLDPSRLRDIVRRTYGRAGAHRLEDEDVEAITFSELKAWMQSAEMVHSEDTVSIVPALEPDRAAAVASLVAAADWMVFAMRDVRPGEAPGSDALKLYLKAGPPAPDTRRVVAIAFDAPYYLDTTEIAKLTAYYAVYARSEPFVEVAIRALFGEVPPLGASPVSVPGAGYDLVQRLQPADQQVSIQLVGGEPSQPVDAGESLTVRTSVVHDANGHVVADGTLVTFRRYVPAEGLYLPDVAQPIQDGAATATLGAERAGELEITAHFAGGLRSDPLVLSVVGEVSATAEPDGTAARPSMAVQRPAVDWGILLFSLSLILLAGAVAQGVDTELGRAPARLVRVFLLSVTWGLGGYLLVATGGLQLETLGLAGAWPSRWNPAYQAPLLSVVLALLPVGPSVAQAARRRRRGPVTPATPESAAS
jgi:beta-N-acetylhexosaminidase